jgi:hypothetical protein
MPVQCGEALARIEACNVLAAEAQQNWRERALALGRNRLRQKRGRDREEDAAATTSKKQKREAAKAPEEALEDARVAQFLETDQKNCKSMAVLENSKFTIIAKKDTSFRKKPRTVVLLRESPMTPYFVPASLFEDLSGLRCPVDVEKIGERVVNGHLIAVVRLAGQKTARHLELELGRAVEMHTLSHNKSYITTQWATRTWYRRERIVFLVDGSSHVLLACNELENVFRANPTSQVEFAVTGVQRITTKSKNAKLVPNIDVIRIL